MGYAQNTGSMRDRGGGRVLEGRAGLAVAAVLAVVVIALVFAEWLLLPDQVIVQFGISGEHYGPKPVIVLVTATLGLGLSLIHIFRQEAYLSPSSPLLLWWNQLCWLGWGGGGAVP